MFNYLINLFNNLNTSNNKTNDLIGYLPNPKLPSFNYEIKNNIIWNNSSIEPDD